MPGPCISEDKDVLEPRYPQHTISSSPVQFSVPHSNYLLPPKVGAPQVEVLPSIWF